MKTFICDIETGPLAEAELATLIPPFDPAAVRTGNLKDPEKIAAKVAEAEAEHRREFIDRAALDPLTGRVLAIGLLDLTPHPHPLPGAERESAPTRWRVLDEADEAALLREFWNICRGDMGRVHQLVGFNVCQFDLPFLIRRSWKHRVDVPFGYRRGRYWSDQVVDLREAWQLGDRMARGSLDTIARHLGVGAKNGEGKDFATLWQADRARAVAYLKNDLELTAKVAAALGVLPP